MEEQRNENVFEITFSKAATYNKCPAKYKYRYIDKLPEEQSYPLTFGSVFHEATKNIIKNAFEYYMLEMLDMFDVEITTESTFRSISEANKLSVDDRATIKQMVKNTYDRYVKPSLLSRNLVMSEVSISFCKKDLPLAVGLQTFYILFRGRVDVVIEEDETTKIVEIKTGSNSFFVENEENVSEERMQAVLYAEAYAKSKNKQVSVEIYYPREDRVIDVSGAEDVLEFANVYLRDAVKGILEKRFDKKKSNLCKFCAFAKVCLKNDETSSIFDSNVNGY